MITTLFIILVVVLLAITVPLFAFILLVVLGCLFSMAGMFADLVSSILQWCLIHINQRAREIEEKGFWK